MSVTQILIKMRVSGSQKIVKRASNWKSIFSMIGTATNGNNPTSQGGF